MRVAMIVIAAIALCGVASVATAADEGSVVEQVKEGCKAELESHWRRHLGG